MSLASTSKQMEGQSALFAPRHPPSGQLLKWIGNKHRHAARIANLLPEKYRCYIEPFVGAGAVLAAMAPAPGARG